MTEAEILQIFRQHSALLEGHFILSSGLHSDRYIQCALVLQHPRVAEQLCSLLANKLRDLRPSVVAARTGPSTSSTQGGPVANGVAGRRIPVPLLLSAIRRPFITRWTVTRRTVNAK